jgi:hypothetical protein
MDDRAFWDIIYRALVMIVRAIATHKLGKKEE